MFNTRAPPLCDHENQTRTSLMSFVVDSWKSEQLSLTVRWPDYTQNLQLQAARVIDAQRWTALLRAETELNSTLMLRAADES